MNSEWYKMFFHGMALDLWRRAATPEMTKGEVDYLLAELKAPPGGRLLDVPCGNGRHVLAMAALGFRVTGLDISPEFIAEATHEAAVRKLQATFCEGDMRELPPGESYDGAWCIGNSFGYFSHEGTLEFLRAIKSALRPGARFILETRMSAESFLPRLQPKREMQFGDVAVTVNSSYDASQSQLTTDYFFTQNGKSETHSSVHQIYTIGEIGRMLKDAGLETVSVHGGVGRESIMLESPDAIFVTKRT